jgi:hypothetical protein
MLKTKAKAPAETSNGSAAGAVKSAISPAKADTEEIKLAKEQF